MGNYPKRVLTPLPFHVKKIFGKYFLGALSVAPSQKSEAILGNIFIPKNLGGPPLRHLSEHFPLSPIVSELILGKHSPHMSENVESSNVKCAGHFEGR